jgi:hypothetical protein
MTKDEALKLALEYIETNAHERRHVRWAIKEALAQPVQDKYQWLVDNSAKWSWNPSNAYKGKVSGFAHKGTGYLGYALDEAVCLAMSDTATGEHMTEEDEEFQRLEREAKMRALEDDDTQDYVRSWVGLTELERAEICDLKWWDWEDSFDIEGFARAIEAKLREKNA